MNAVPIRGSEIAGMPMRAIPPRFPPTFRAIRRYGSGVRVKVRSCYKLSLTAPLETAARSHSQSLRVASIRLSHMAAFRIIQGRRTRLAWAHYRLAALRFMAVCCLTVAGPAIMTAQGMTAQGDDESALHGPYCCNFYSQS